MTSSQGGYTDFQLLRHRNIAYERFFDHGKLIEPNGNHWLTKGYKLHLQTPLHLSSETSTEDNEIERCLFRTAVITAATNCCGRKRVGET